MQGVAVAVELAMPGCVYIIKFLYSHSLQINISVKKYKIKINEDNKEYKYTY